VHEEVEVCGGAAATLVVAADVDTGAEEDGGVVGSHDNR